MRKKYKIVMMPLEAKTNFMNKKNIINEILREEKIKKNFTLADTLRYFSQKRIFVPNQEILSFIKNKKNKKILI